MGQVMAQGLGACPQFSLVALVDLHEPAELFGARYVAALDGLDPASVDAVVDFSNPEAVVSSARW